MLFRAYRARDIAVSGLTPAPPPVYDLLNKAQDNTMTYIPPERLVWNFCPICGRKLVLAHDGEADHPHCAPCHRFFYYNPVPATCCFLRRDDGALLLVRRGIEPCKGEWSLPGGFLELNESPEEGIIREIREETGFHISNIRLLGAKTKPSPINGAILVLGFTTEHWTGTLETGSDVMEAAFFLPHERPNLVFTVHRELLALYDALYA